jgi:hypothetical protein
VSVDEALAVLAAAGWKVHDRNERGRLSAGILITSYSPDPGEFHKSRMLVEPWAPSTEGSQP